MKNKSNKAEGISEKAVIRMMIKDNISDKKITESTIRQKARKIYETRVIKGISGDED